MMRAKERQHKAADVSIGRRMKSRRAMLGLTQAQLAALAGVSTATIAYMEQGRVSPTMETLARVSAALDVSLDWLVRGDEFTAAA